MPTLTDDEIRLSYGPAAVITRRGNFAFVHLDAPSLDLQATRTAEFNPDQYFEDDCPMCRLIRAGGVIVFDDGAYDAD